jgi:[ribosomal protein S5]-alanine N-acetyltransferase
VTKRVLGRTERLEITEPGRRDRVDVVAAVVRSRELHHPWLAGPADAEAYAGYLRRIRQPQHHGYLLRLHPEGDVVGIVNVSDVVLGSFRSAHLSYYAFAGHERQGLLTEGLRWAIDHAFDVLELHRLEANIQPGNTASLRLVAACGLRLEGFSPRYLHIDGAWRDHERWAITAEDRDGEG